LAKIKAGCEIAWEREHLQLSSLQAIEMRLEYIENEPSRMNNSGELAVIMPTTVPILYHI